MPRDHRPPRLHHFDDDGDRDRYRDGEPDRDPGDGDGRATGTQRVLLKWAHVDLLCVATLCLIVLHMAGILPAASSFWRAARASEMPVAAATAAEPEGNP